MERNQQIKKKTKAVFVVQQMQREYLQDGNVLKINFANQQNQKTCSLNGMKLTNRKEAKLSVCISTNVKGVFRRSKCLKNKLCTSKKLRNLLLEWNEVRINIFVNIEMQAKADVTFL